MCYGLNQTESAILIMDWCLYDTLKDKVLAKCPALKHIVLVGECWVPQETEGGESKPFPKSAEELSTLQGNASYQLHTKDTVQEKGRSSNDVSDLAQYEPETDDLAFIMYTSGSTGNPR